MSTTEQIYALLVAANPVPDPDTSPEPVAQTRPHLHVVDPRRRVMQTEHEPQQSKTAEVIPPRRRTPGWIWAAAALIMVVLVAAAVVVVRSNGDEGPVASEQPAPITATTAVETPSPVAGGEISAQIRVVEAATAAYNAYDADAYAAYWGEGIEGPGAYIVGSDDWRSFIAEEQARGIEITLSDCEATENVVRCVETYQETLLSGKAGVILTWEAEYRFDEAGLIIGFAQFNKTGTEAIGPFEDALGRWMATAHPEVFETYYVPDFYSRKYENWFTPQGAAQLSQLIDEFIADSDEYPLNGQE